LVFELRTSAQARIAHLSNLSKHEKQRSWRSDRDLAQLQLAIADAGFDLLERSERQVDTLQGMRDPGLLARISSQLVGHYRGS
jgi:hypothetical protein